MLSRIRSARIERGWSQAQLISELERVAARRGDRLPGRETLKSRVSRWENGRARPDGFYQRLLREAFGLDDRELGFCREVDDGVAPAIDELRARLNLEMAPQDTLIDALRCQSEAIRQQDRQFGAAALLEQMRGHVANCEQHLAHAVFDPARRPLARLLADAAALAGWQALDLGALDQSWRFFEVATRSAHQAQDRALLAFARIEQAHVLLDLDNSAAAAQLTQSVWEAAQGAVSPGVRCWLAAATAEMHAGAVNRRQAATMMAVAERAAEHLDGELPPYLVFNQAHLERWLGHSLVLLGDPAAEERLRCAADSMDRTFTRAGAALRIDLAAALLRRGERDEADLLLRQAELLARKASSRRQLGRLRRLREAS
jgi:transcriptional regulator with XRE-family HTH domain